MGKLVGWCLGVSCAFAVWLGAGRAEAAPKHEGFTGDIGLGVGLTYYPYTAGLCADGAPPGCVSHPIQKSKGQLGPAFPSLSLGAFVTPKLALLARTAATAYSPGDDVGTEGNTFYGAIVEWWPIDEVFLSAGPGLGLFGEWPLVTLDKSKVSGFALDFRAGGALVQAEHSDFILSVEVTPGFYEGGTVTSLAMVGAFKWY